MPLPKLEHLNQLPPEASKLIDPLSFVMFNSLAKVINRQADVINALVVIIETIAAKD